jgi:hypothetical protein
MEPEESVSSESVLRVPVSGCQARRVSTRSLELRGKICGETADSSPLLGSGSGFGWSERNNVLRRKRRSNPASLNVNMFSWESGVEGEGWMLDLDERIRDSIDRYTPDIKSSSIVNTILTIQGNIIMGRHSHQSPSADRRSEVLSAAKRKIKVMAEKLGGLKGEVRVGLKGIEAVISALEVGPSSSSSSSLKTIISTSSSFRFLQTKLNTTRSVLSAQFGKVLGPFLTRKPSKSNLSCVFLSLLALIFYLELHTSSGFTRFWLKWENVDLRSVEVSDSLLRSRHLKI